MIISLLSWHSPAHLFHLYLSPSPALLALLLSCCCFFHALLLFPMLLQLPVPLIFTLVFFFLLFLPPSFPYLTLPLLFFRWTTPQFLALVATTQTFSSSVMWVLSNAFLIDLDSLFCINFVILSAFVSGDPTEADWWGLQRWWFQHETKGVWLTIFLHCLDIV